MKTSSLLLAGAAAFVAYQLAPKEIKERLGGGGTSLSVSLPQSENPLNWEALSSILTRPSSEKPIEMPEWLQHTPDWLKDIPDITLPKSLDDLGIPNVDLLGGGNGGSAMPLDINALITSLFGGFEGLIENVPKPDIPSITPPKIPDLFTGGIGGIGGGLLNFDPSVVWDKLNFDPSFVWDKWTNYITGLQEDNLGIKRLIDLLYVGGIGGIGGGLLNFDPSVVWDKWTNYITGWQEGNLGIKRLTDLLYVNDISTEYGRNVLSSRELPPDMQASDIADYFASLKNQPESATPVISEHTVPASSIPIVREKPRNVSRDVSRLKAEKRKNASNDFTLGYS